MREITDDPKMPASNMIYQAMHSNEAFRGVIARGREAQQEAEIEKTVAIADAATPETVNVAKLRIWARQWRAAKLAPKKYGEKVTQEHTGADGGPIEVAPPLCPSEVAARVADMLAENEAILGLPAPKKESLGRRSAEADPRHRRADHPDALRSNCDKAQNTMSINAITDQDRASAVVQILCSAEIQLEFRGTRAPASRNALTPCCAERSRAAWSRENMPRCISSARRR